MTDLDQAFAEVRAANPLWSDKHVRFAVQLMPTTDSFAHPEGTATRRQAERHHLESLHAWRIEMGLAQPGSFPLLPPPVATTSKQQSEEPEMFSTPPCRDMDHFLEVYPYATEGEATAARDAMGSAATHMIAGGVRDGVSRYRLQDPSVCYDAAGNEHAQQPKVRREPIKREGLTKKQQVLNMLQAAPQGISAAQIVDLFGCSAAAATALISDVKRMGNNVLKTIEGNETVYKLIP